MPSAKGSFNRRQKLSFLHIGVLATCIFIWCSAGYGDRPRFETVGQSLRGYASTLLVKDGMAYVTMGSALVIFDVSDPDSVVETGRVYAQTCYDANPTLINLQGGKYLVVASDLYGYLVFDVSECIPGEPSCTPSHMMTLFDPIPGSVTDPGGGVFFKPGPEQGGHLYCANGQRGLKIYRASTTPEGQLEGFMLVDVFTPPPGDAARNDRHGILCQRLREGRSRMRRGHAELASPVERFRPRRA